MNDRKSYASFFGVSTCSSVLLEKRSLRNEILKSPQMAEEKRIRMLRAIANVSEKVQALLASVANDNERVLLKTLFSLSSDTVSEQTFRASINFFILIFCSQIKDKQFGAVKISTLISFLLQLQQLVDVNQLPKKRRNIRSLICVTPDFDAPTRPVRITTTIHRRLHLLLVRSANG